MPPSPIPAIALPIISAVLECAVPQMMEPNSNRLMATMNVNFTYKIENMALFFGIYFPH